MPQTNALIVEPEYEAAWKQAERAFQDVLKLALADIGKTDAANRSQHEAASRRLRSHPQNAGVDCQMCRFSA